MKKIVAFLLLFIMAFCGVSCTEKGFIDNTEEKVKKYYIDFSTNGGSSIATKYTDVLDYSPVTSKSDAIFDGWYLDKYFKVPAVFPLKVESDMTLYAKWLKTQDKRYCENTSIKWAKGHSSSSLYYITPNGFDLQTLAQKGYAMEISVEYVVYYKKDYNVWLDIGYAGSPKYEVFLVNSQGIGAIEKNLPTTTGGRLKGIKFVTDVVDLLNEKITLTFSTDNIQNIIYFQDILVTYKCYK